ncbi:MAG: 1-acyl-sn-glycerol-3-phosphate acyltransferase [Spirochaetales bacterium]|nr:1-acyl-sn-glycerol-3-phosphate acyltransferase [Spirochaetales bacterium]
MADFFFRGFARAICNIDNRELEKVPNQGPLIIVMNHINFLEVPLMHLELYPRPFIGMVKKETWNNKFLGFLFSAWDSIPVDRNAADFSALRLSLDVLKRDKILCIAPEGTRSGDGRLLQGQPGIVFLALHSGAPILPVVHYGGENIWPNLKKLRKTKIVFKVGKPFRLVKPSGKLTGVIREEMTTEIMWQLASLLPETYWGYYADAGNVTARHLEFI